MLIEGKNEKKEKECSEIGEYDAELTQNMKLKSVKRCSLDMTFDKARKILAEKSLRSIKEYYELCEKDVRFSREPDVDYSGKFTNWVHYLGIPYIYYDVDMCKKKVQEYMTMYPELKNDYLLLDKLCEKLCALDNNFPQPDIWCAYYEIKQLRDIIVGTFRKKMIVKI